jgi:hypothetical protein
MVSQGGSNVRLSVLSVQCEARRSGPRKVDLFPVLKHVFTNKMEFGGSFGEKNWDLWIWVRLGSSAFLPVIVESILSSQVNLRFQLKLFIKFRWLVFFGYSNHLLL